MALGNLAKGEIYAGNDAISKIPPVAQTARDERQGLSKIPTHYISSNLNFLIKEVA